jgi:hypothetical protein
MAFSGQGVELGGRTLSSLVPSFTVPALLAGVG